MESCSSGKLDAKYLKLSSSRPHDHTEEPPQINLSLCMICYNEKSKEPLTSGAVGRKRVLEAAEKEDGIVLKRLKLVPEGCNFMYHNTSRCYKEYTRCCKDSVDDGFVHEPMETTHPDDQEHIQTTPARKIPTRSQVSLYSTLLCQVS